MKLGFTSGGWEDYLYRQTNEQKSLARLNELIRQCIRDPFRGIGKPEPLRENFAGWWSRRITDKHRLVYRVIGKGDEQRLEIAQCRFHC